MPKKIDFKKELKEFYNPSAKEVSLVNVPKMNFLMISGKGAPKDKEYKNAIEALYAVAYTIKFLPKKGEKIKGFKDYTVPPLEGQWWIKGKDFDPKKDLKDKSKWFWNSMIMQPDFVTAAVFKKALNLTSEKKNIPNLDKVQLKSFKEGLSVQTMHIGPFSTEPETVKKMYDFEEENGLVEHGYHHEIYLSDFRKVDPKKMKTVLRHPVRKK